MHCDESKWLGMLLVGLASLAISAPAEGQEFSIEPPSGAIYENSEPQFGESPDSNAPTSNTPALGQSRAWLLPGRQGERMPIWRAWRRGAAIGSDADASTQAIPVEGASRPLFRGQFLARGMAAIGRLRESAGRGPSSSDDAPRLDIDLGLPAEDFAMPRTSAPPPSYGTPSYGTPDFETPIFIAPEFGPQGTGVAGGVRGDGSGAPQFPRVPPEAQYDAPELNIEIEAPTSPEAPPSRQRSVLAPGRFPRGR